MGSSAHVATDDLALAKAGGKLTPVQEHGGFLVKRDDLYSAAGVQGGKVRTCMALAKGAEGLVTAGSRKSPQVNIVAHVAKALGIPCRVFVPSGDLTPELQAAQDAGAEVVKVTPGHNSVIKARARDDAAKRGWTLIPFGMECAEAVTQTRQQVANVPKDVKRIVVPVGSGMSLAGVLWGLDDAERDTPVLGVVVGADPKDRLDEYAPPGWQDMVKLVKSKLDYHDEVEDPHLGDLLLDPVYEAKCLPFLEKGDMLWCVGVRQTADGGATTKAVDDYEAVLDEEVLAKAIGTTVGKGHKLKLSAAWASKRLDCTEDGITRDGGCGGRCCNSKSFWPPVAGKVDGACDLLGDKGCTLKTADKPVGCLLYPLKLNKTGTTIVLHHRAPNGLCKPNMGKGPMLIEAMAGGLATLLGKSVADDLVAAVKAGKDPELELPDEVVDAMRVEARWEAKGLVPRPRQETLAKLRDKRMAKGVIASGSLDGGGRKAPQQGKPDDDLAKVLDDDTADNDAAAAVVKSVRGLWGSTAGKSRVAGRVVDMIPAHKVYVEPFAGGAAVFYRKAKSASETEVLCDANPEVAAAFAFVRDATADQIAKVQAKDWIVSKDTALAVHELATDGNPVDRFYRFAYKRFALFFRNENRITAVDPSKVGKAATIPARFAQVQQRLQGVQVHSGDYGAVLDKYDGPETFYYLDPPYPQCTQEVGEDDFDEAAFIKRLRKLRGSFLLHYDVRSLDTFKAVGREEGWLVRTVPVSATGGHTQGHKAASLLEVANYVPQGGAPKLPQDVAKDASPLAVDLDPVLAGADPQALDVLLAKRKSPLRVMGTLEPFFAKLLSWMPDHDTYVEPFGGPAELLFEKEPAATEAINDKDDRTAAFWQSLKALTDKDLDWLEGQEWTRSRDLFHKWRDADDSPGKGLVYKIMYCTGCNLRPIGGQFKNYRNDADGRPITTWKRLRPAVKRLQDVEITSLDFQEVIDKYDGPNTFFYMDPPFHGTGGYYRTDLDDDGHARIYNAVAKLKGKAMVWNTYNAHVVKLIKDAGLDYRVLRKAGLLHRMTGNGKKWNYFVLASNYDLSGTAKAKGLAPVAKDVGLSAGLVYKAAGAMDFAEGDQGVGVVQTHERGLSKLQVDMLAGIAWGWNAVEAPKDTLDRMAALVPGDWPGAVKAVQAGKPDKLAALVQQAIADHGKDLQDQDALALATLRPVQITTDVRLRRVVPDKDDYWQGGPVLTPGNQFRANVLLDIAQADKPDGKGVQADFTVPAPEADDGEGNALVRGDLDWMDMGADAPAVLDPDEDGQDQGYSRVAMRDVLRWAAGTQAADFKEFWFDGSYLKGRWLAVQQAVGPGGSKVWAWTRPKDQRPGSKVLADLLRAKAKADAAADDGSGADKAVGKAITVQLVKAKTDDAQRLVYGVALVPDVVDAQGDVITAAAIAKAAHDFVMRYGKDTLIGLQHKFFDRKLAMVESYLAPVDLDLGGQKITAGSWVLAVKVLDDDVWAGVKSGQIRGFSIGGVATKTEPA
jgi:site-specific DNA-adenine methylase